MLQVLTEEASRCCQRAFDKALEAGDTGALGATKETWSCPRCGQGYRALQEGPIRAWMAVCDAFLIPARVRR